MTQKEFESLMRHGHNLLTKIAVELNDVTDKFVYDGDESIKIRDRLRSQNAMAAALALYVRKTTAPMQNATKKIVVIPKNSTEQKTVYVKPKHQYPERARMKHFLEKYGIRFKEGNDGSSYIRVDFTDEGESK